ncbi:hypothetical protein ACP275_08G125000 [Erythranthe tilingii]
MSTTSTRATSGFHTIRIRPAVWRWKLLRFSRWRKRRPMIEVSVLGSQIFVSSKPQTESLCFPMRSTASFCVRELSNPLTFQHPTIISTVGDRGPPAAQYPHAPLAPGLARLAVPSLLPPLWA